MILYLGIATLTALGAGMLIWQRNTKLAIEGLIQQASQRHQVELCSCLVELHWLWPVIREVEFDVLWPADTDPTTVQQMQYEITYQLDEWFG